MWGKKTAPVPYLITVASLFHSYKNSPEETSQAHTKYLVAYENAQSRLLLSSSEARIEAILHGVVLAFTVERLVPYMYDLFLADGWPTDCTDSPVF
jgi:hypothetical protein